MATKHQAVDSRGAVHKRTSANRVYSHCVVIHVKARPADKYWPNPRNAYTRAEWASRRDLAEKNAATWRGLSHIEAVEIIPATII